MNLMVSQYKFSVDSCMYVKLKLVTLSSLRYFKEVDVHDKFIKNSQLIVLNINGFCALIGLVSLYFEKLQEVTS